jgi:alkylmercury lyase
MTSAGGPLQLDALCDAVRDGVAARQAGLPSGVRQMHRAVLRAFLETGHAPHAADLPRPVGIDRDEALALLHRLDLVHLDRAGQVVAAYPFSGRPTAHSVRLDDGPPLHAMCALDAVGIPLMARRDAVIVSADPIDWHPILVEQRDTTWRCGGRPPTRWFCWPNQAAVARPRTASAQPSPSTPHVGAPRNSCAATPS